MPIHFNAKIDEHCHQKVVISMHRHMIIARLLLLQECIPDWPKRADRESSVQKTWVNIAQEISNPISFWHSVGAHAC